MEETLTVYRLRVPGPAPPYPVLNERDRAGHQKEESATSCGSTLLLGKAPSTPAGSCLLDVSAGNNHLGRSRVLTRGALSKDGPTPERPGRRGAIAHSDSLL